MFGPSSGVVHELWRIISNKKNGKMLCWYCVMQVLDGLSSWLYVGETSSIPQSSRQRHLIIQLGRKNAWQQKAKKCLVTTYIGVELEHKRSRLRSFVSIIILRFAFLVCPFFAFCYLILAGLHLVTFSDYYESILFHVGSSAFEISTKLAVIVAQ